MNSRIAAEVFPPGEFLRDELEARDWTQQQLAEIMGRPPRVISEIIQAKRAITPETAVGLSSALGTSAQFWMNLESQHALSKVKVDSDEVAKRARLHSKFPVREMRRRSWLPPSETAAELERHVTQFFEDYATNDAIGFAVAAKKTAHVEPLTFLQLAWLLRCRQMAKRQVVGTYSESGLRSALRTLHSYLSAPEEARHVPRLLRESGVCFVMVEALPASKIDGACFWLSSTRPVIAMSLRFDRIDNFWFVLRHEIEHVLRGDGQDKQLGVIDEDLGEVPPADANPAELAADLAAATWTIPAGELDDFVARVNPFFSETKILGFAGRLGVHPGIVIGQLQRRIQRHDLLRRLQVKVRSVITSTGDADGWGSVPNVQGEST